MPTLDTATLERLINEYFQGGRKESLNAIASPYPIDDLVRAFESLRRSTLRLLNGLTEKQIMYSPDANTYSMSEVVSHLVAAQGMTYNAFLDVVSSTLPHVDPVPRNPGGGAEKGLTAPMLQDRLQKASDDLVKIVRSTYDPAKEAKEVMNPVFGSLTYKAWLFFQLVHDLDHLKQVQVLRRSAGFPSKHD
jgi:hypothetical protein